MRGGRAMSVLALALKRSSAVPKGPSLGLPSLGGGNPETETARVLRLPGPNGDCP